LNQSFCKFTHEANRRDFTFYPGKQSAASRSISRQSPVSSKQLRTLTICGDIQNHFLLYCNCFRINVFCLFRDVIGVLVNEQHYRKQILHFCIVVPLEEAVSALTRKSQLKSMFVIGSRHLSRMALRHVGHGHSVPIQTTTAMAIVREQVTIGIRMIRTFQSGSAETAQPLELRVQQLSDDGGRPRFPFADQRRPRCKFGRCVHT
jgi:hypothetical protein